MICKICGSKIEDGAQFCDICGAAQAKQSRSQFDVTSSLVEQERTIKKRAAKRTLILIIAIIVVVVALFIALLSTGILGNVFGGGDQPADESTTATQTTTDEPVTASETTAAATEDDAGYIKDAGQKDFIGTWTCYDYDEKNTVYDEFIVSFNNSGFQTNYSISANGDNWASCSRYNISNGTSSAKDGKYALVENDNANNGPYSERKLVFFIDPNDSQSHSKKQYEFEKTSEEGSVSNGLYNTIGTWYEQNSGMTLVFNDDGSFIITAANGEQDVGKWRICTPGNGSAPYIRATSNNDASTVYIFTYNADNDFRNYESGRLTANDLVFTKTPKQSSSTETTTTSDNSGQNNKTT